MRRRAMLALSAMVLAGAAGAAVLPAAAQENYPTKPVRIIVPYAPGGATDITARLIGEQLREQFGQTFIVENKPGAFGIVAIEEMARAKPDGYTLMLGNPSTNVITPIVHAKRMSIDYEKMVTAVADLVDVPSFFLVTTKNFAPKTMAEFIAYAKAHPGELKYGSAGVGSFPHYSMEIFNKKAGIKVEHVPNSGGGAAYLKDIMIGDLQFGTMNAATAGPVMKGDRVRALAVTSNERLADYPDIPTYKELGHARPGDGFWQAMFAPAATPQPILEKLHAAVLKAMQNPDFIAATDKNRMTRVPHATLAEEQAWLKKEFKEWREVVAQVPIEKVE